MRFFEAYKYYYNHFGFSAAVSLVLLPRISSHIPIHKVSYHTELKKFLRKDIQDIIDKYKFINIGNQKLSESKNVFTLWWQGVDSLPDVVELCHESLCKNINGYKLIRLDKNNIYNYIDIPDFVQQRVKKGEMSFSHFSDIIRLILLSKYGGVWVDSCLFVVKPLQFTSQLSMPRFQSDNSLNLGKWCFGIIHSPQGHKLINFILESLLRYWGRYDAAVDYLMFDGFMMIAYEEFEDIREEIDQFEINSPDLHRTRYLFDKPYNAINFNSFIADNQFLSLTWRVQYPEMANGTKTYYAALKEWLNNQALN